VLLIDAIVIKVRDAQVALQRGPLGPFASAQIALPLDDALLDELEHVWVLEPSPGRHRLDHKTAVTMIGRRR
jgi:hypothetical protein